MFLKEGRKERRKETKKEGRGKKRRKEGKTKGRKRRTEVGEESEGGRREENSMCVCTSVVVCVIVKQRTGLLAWWACFLYLGNHILTNKDLSFFM